MNKSQRISIILPTYNEAENITSLIYSLKKNLKDFKKEIIVVDDNSPDKTFQKTKINFKKDNEVKVFIRKNDRGLAKSIRFGLEKTTGNIIVVMDTDFNHDPKIIPLMIKEMEQNDLVVGSRYVNGGGMENKIRYLLSLLYNLTIRLILRLPTYDNLSGFYAVKKGKLKVLPFDQVFSGYGDYFIRFLYFSKKKRFKIKEIPVFYKNRTAGESKSRFIPMFMDYTKTVIELMK